MPNEKTSLTSAVYHLQMYNIYMEDFKRDCRQAAKHDAGKWVSKGQWLMNDIYSTMTPESKEIFEREIKKGDVMFHPAISEKLMKMDEHQRTFVETVCDMLLKGEKIELLEEDKPRHCIHTYKAIYIGVGYVSQCTKCGAVKQ